MANSTVYPYGTGGSLPTSIGLVNDLKTGGVDKALTAQQGVVLDGMVEDAQYSEKTIDISQYTYSLGTYINATSNKWASSDNSKSFMVPVVPGYTYKLTGNATATSRYALLKTAARTAGTSPNYATGETAIHTIIPGETAEFIAPADAMYLNINSTVASTDVMPQTLIELAPYRMLETDKAMGMQYYLFIGGMLDAVSESETFGKVIAATNNDWGVSQYIDLKGASHIRYYANTASSSNNYAGKTGTIFYDENMAPLTSGVRLIQYSSIALAEWIEQEIPSGARYFRVTVSATLQNSIAVQLYNRLFEPTNYFKYFGEKVNFDSKRSYKWSVFATGGMNGQSAAIYGKYLFIVTDGFTTVMLYDMEAKASIYTWTTNFNKASIWHCNQSTFTATKYDPDDMFPLFYTCAQNNASGRCIWEAYRIVPTLADGEIVSFEMTLIQKIYLPIMTDTNCLGNANPAYDEDNNCFWAYSRNNNTEAANVSQARFTRFNVPAIFDGNSQVISEVTLEDSDIKEAFSDDFSMVNTQGGFIKGGRLYIMRGYPNAGYIQLRVIDLYAKRKQITFVDFYKDGLRVEPEGVFFYNGYIHCTINGTSIYRFIFN